MTGRFVAVIAAGTMLAGPALAARGPRGGEAVRGPRGGAAVEGPRGGEAVRGPRGAGAAEGPYGGEAVRGPRGGAAVEGPGGNTAVRGPRTEYVSPRGARYVRPGWNSAQVNVYAGRYARYPGYRTYGVYYGLTPALAPFTALAFLSAGMLVASYAEKEKTVYVYVVEEGGKNIEYRVDEAGNVLSQKFVD